MRKKILTLSSFWNEPENKSFSRSEIPWGREGRAGAVSRRQKRKSRFPL